MEKDGSEEEETEMLFEEVEVLPYDSVFDWTLTDPLGFYKEDERYHKLTAFYGQNEAKKKVIEDMWYDRTKYHILIRFTWPPKTTAGAFYSRGYYEDFDSRPTVDINEVTDNPVPKDSSKKTKAYKTVKKDLLAQVMEEDEGQGIQNEGNNAEDYPKVTELVQVGGASFNKVIEVEDPKQRKKSSFNKAGGLRSSFDGQEKSISPLTLNVLKIPYGIGAAHFERMFPNGNVILKPHNHGKDQKATIKFVDPNEAAAAYKRLQHESIRGHKLEVSFKRGEDSMLKLDGEVHHDGDAHGRGHGHGHGHGHGPAHPHGNKKGTKKTRHSVEHETEDVEEVTNETEKKHKKLHKKNKKKHGRERDLEDAESSDTSISFKDKGESLMSVGTGERSLPSVGTGERSLLSVGAAERSLLSVRTGERSLLSVDSRTRLPKKSKKSKKQAH